MTTILETNQLTKTYGKKNALDALTIKLEEGEVLGYLGPNGAGKTTTIRLILGLIAPTKGSISLFGNDITSQGSRSHADIAYVPGETSLWPNMTGAETLTFLANIHGSVDRKYQAELIKRFEFDPNKRVRAYSKGNRQKISLIAAFASRAKLLILDEPTSGLDPVMAKVFRDEVLAAKARKQTVLLSSHILEEVEELCDHIAVLKDGKLIEYGTLDELRHLAAVTVEASFTGIPPNVKNIEGVSNVTVHDSFLRCHVTGSMAELLEVIAKAKPISFVSRKPSLEELFLELYSTGAAAK